ncbi:MAG: SDR family oxidoreductase [Devosia nanyangense]|jgi:3-oxoacyl-[acyl-carrier protein] reductase|nr:SDR family oxidoreductase [Devosia nanyangense]
MAFDLTGKVALVTGGGRGIGAAIVTRLAEAGAKVVAANRTLEHAEALAATVPNVSAALLPGTDRASLRALVDGVAERHGRLDILVHNAGGCPWADIEDLTEDQLEAALDINLKASIWLAQAAIAHMKRNNWGRILVTSSVSARVAMGGGAHYSAAKAGVNAFIRGAALELARTGITVNGVEPGFIAKPGRGKMGTPEMMATLGAEIPMGRMGEPDDVAYAMLYLASEESRYMTGQTIVVDGGSTLPETGYAVHSLWGHS